MRWPWRRKRKPWPERSRREQTAVLAELDRLYDEGVRLRASAPDAEMADFMSARLTALAEIRTRMRTEAGL